MLWTDEVGCVEIWVCLGISHPKTMALICDKGGQKAGTEVT